MDAAIEGAQLLQERGHLAFRMGDHAAAARWADEALAYAQSVPPDVDKQAGLEAARATAEALNTKGVALARLGRCQEAAREGERRIATPEDASPLNPARPGHPYSSERYTRRHPVP